MTYSAIENSEIDTDSAITTTLMQKFRDNLLAVIQGLANAPRIVPGALSASHATISYGPYSGVAEGFATPSAEIGTRTGIVEIVMDVSLTNASIGEDGTVKIQGSNDNATWADIAVTDWVFGDPPTDKSFDMTVYIDQPNDGDTVYRYYRGRADGDADVDVTLSFTVQEIAGKTP